jgi:hypothetical protein
MMNFPPRSLHLTVLACLLAPPLAGCGGGGGTPPAPAANSHPAAPGTITLSETSSAKQPREGTAPAAAASDSRRPAVHELGKQTSSGPPPSANPGVQPPPQAAPKLPTAGAAAKAQYAGVYVKAPAAPAAPADLSDKITNVTVSIDPSGQIEGSALRLINSRAPETLYSFHGQLPKAGNSVTMTLRNVNELPPGEHHKVTLKLVPGASHGTVTFDFPGLQGADREVAVTRPAVKPRLLDGAEYFDMSHTVVITAQADPLYGSQGLNQAIRLTRDGTLNRWHLHSTGPRLMLSADLTPTGVAGVFDASIHLNYSARPIASKVIKGSATLYVDEQTGSRQLILSAHGEANALVRLVAAHS